MPQLSETTLETLWATDPRWKGIVRAYSAKDVVRLRGSVHIEHSLARMGADRLWKLLHEEGYLSALSALTGNQALQQIVAGLQAVYVGGWQVAGDANLAGQMYPDESLYPSNSVPAVVREINNAFIRADQINHAEGNNAVYWYAPVVADAEAGFGGSLNAFELMKAMIEAGAAGVHFEDQLAAAKKCGHLGGKVLVPAHEFVKKLVAARLASDILGVPTLLIARTDAQGAQLLLNDSDDRDLRFVTDRKTEDGYLGYKGGLEAAITRALIYAPYVDMLWCETSRPDIGEAREFAQAVHQKCPGKMLAFDWSQPCPGRGALSSLQGKLAEIGFRFQFVALAGFHALNQSMFDLASCYSGEGVTAYWDLLRSGFAKAKKKNYAAAYRERFVGTGYYDDLALTIGAGKSSTLALEGLASIEHFV